MAGQNDEIGKIGDGGKKDVVDNSSRLRDDSNQSDTRVNANNIDATRKNAFGEGGLMAGKQAGSKEFDEHTAEVMKGSPEQIKDQMKENDRMIEATKLHIKTIEAALKNTNAAEQAHYKLLNEQRKEQ